MHLAAHCGGVVLRQRLADAVESLRTDARHLEQLCAAAEDVEGALAKLADEQRRALRPDPAHRAAAQE